MQKKSYKIILASPEGKAAIFKDIPNPNAAEDLQYVIEDSSRFGKEYTSVLKVDTGDHAPRFNLPNAVNQMVSLDHILKEKNAIVIFYRGGWCPFCNLQLRVYQNYLEEFEEAGAALIAISPQIPDQSLSVKERQQLGFEVLSDIGNKIARKYTTILRYSEVSTMALRGIGINLDEYYEDGISEVPIPAVFIIDKTGKIIFAKSEGGDYKKRVEPEEILNVLNRLLT